MKYYEDYITDYSLNSHKEINAENRYKYYKDRGGDLTRKQFAFVINMMFMKIVMKMTNEKWPFILPFKMGKMWLSAKRGDFYDFVIAYKLRGKLYFYSMAPQKVYRWRVFRKMKSKYEKDPIT